MMMTNICIGFLLHLVMGSYKLINYTFNLYNIGIFNFISQDGKKKLSKHKTFITFSVLTNL